MEETYPFSKPSLTERTLTRAKQIADKAAQKDRLDRPPRATQVVSLNNLGAINPSDKRKKETNEEVVLESKSLDEFMVRCQNILHRLISCVKDTRLSDIQDNVKELVKVVKALIRTEGLNKNAELERRESTTANVDTSSIN